ncbi:unnamed protein product [Paramecium octaurelia]|uniref:Uncharacterized protein n=1 Tax=Paramecium octaurelia TaxID=43137 RepID=A0A8S1W8J4_PAROT|nr:unnamed protein product [Paramecium octaurelia]
MKQKLQLKLINFMDVLFHHSFNIMSQCQKSDIISQFLSGNFELQKGVLNIN